MLWTFCFFSGAFRSKNFTIFGILQTFCYLETILKCEISGDLEENFWEVAALRGARVSGLKSTTLLDPFILDNVFKQLHVVALNKCS